MTWLRWEANSAFTDVVDELASTMKIPAAHAYGLYVATCNGFGQFRKDGNVTAVLDSALEDWARWKGRPGRWAAAFRSRCADENGQLRGWWRNAAVLRKQEKDASRPPAHLRDIPAENSPDSRAGITGESRGNPRGNLGGDVDDDVDGNGTTPATAPARAGRASDRLLQRLVGQPGRFAVLDFLDRVPEPRLRGWQDCLVGCLDGLGIVQGQAATVGELAAACSDYAQKVALEQWDFDNLRTFVDRLVKRRLRGQHQTASQPRETRSDRERRTVERFASGGES